jgi:hypothetical protein
MNDGKSFYIQKPLHVIFCDIAALYKCKGFIE